MDCPEPGAFSGFVSGALSTDERDRLEVHMDACETCRVTLSEVWRGSALAAAHRPRALPMPGDRVGRYTIVEQLGSGAMGVVYLASDDELDRKIALKLVGPQAGDPEHALVQERMRREGRMLARIDHPNVVRVFDVGDWYGAVFVAMEHVPGSALGAWLAAAPRSRSEIVAVFAQCASGLAAAHEAGVIHRDFKPDNVIVDASGRARVSDFGLAQAGDGESSDMPARTGAPLAMATGSADVRLTRTRGIVGTPAYMAPEQHRGDRVDGRTDQFALCVALAEALGGERPFTGGTIEELLTSIDAGRPKLARSIPRRLRTVLVRGLAADPVRRHESLVVVRRALERRSAWRWIIPSLLAVAIAAVVGAVATRNTSDGERCDSSAIKSVWTPERQALLGAAFERSGMPFARRAWEYARPRLDGYASKWVAVREELCRAGEPQGATRGSTLRCLERRALELRAMVERWQLGERPALADAAQVVDALEPIEHCRAAELDPLPADDAARSHLAELERRLVDARAQQAAGHVTEAVAEYTALERELRDAGFFALEAKTLIEVSGAERRLGRNEPARNHLIAAIAAAERAGASRTKARAWIVLAELAGDDAMELDVANDALRLSAAVLDSLGRPETLVSQHELASGVVALGEGDHQRAIAAFRRSLAATAPLAATERSRRLQYLARGLMAAGDAPAAQRELERAEATLTEVLGRDAPQLVPVLSSMTDTLEYLARPKEAIERGERALAIFDASFGTESPRRTAILGNLAVLYSDSNPARSLSLEQQVLDAQLRHLGPDHHYVGVAHLNLGTSLIHAGRAQEALGHLERALAIAIATQGAMHQNVGNVYAALSSARRALHHPDQAVAHARRAAEIWEAAKVGTGQVAYGRYSLALALGEAGDWRAAIAEAQRALALPLAKTGREADLAALIREWIKANRARAR